MPVNSKYRIAIVGYGNVGKHVAQAILASRDLELAGIVRRRETINQGVSLELKDIPIVPSIKDLDNIDGACLSVPTREVPKYAREILGLGINTVDSYDIHKELVNVKKELHNVAKKAGSVAIVSAGWDPGTDSLIRIILEIMAPSGITHTNFGPGISMGHTAVVKALPGVKDGISLTYPKGQGIHRRMVYVELEKGFDFEYIKDLIINDPYFKNDETVVLCTSNVNKLKDVGHGVTIERKGVSGIFPNQRFNFQMNINNPALTGQVMVNSIRASFKQSPGAYTLIELPLIDFLEGDRECLLARLM